MAKIKRIEPFGSLVHFTDDCTTLRMNKEETEEYLNFEGRFPDELSAPEIVHLELTGRCNKNCEYCYVNEQDELTTKQWEEVIDDIRSAGVFQFTFGGGEPFMRHDIFELAKWVRKIKQRNLAVTTNGTLFREDERLKYFDQINFSHHGTMEAIRRPIIVAQDYSNVGINFLIRQDTLEDLPEVVKFCKRNNIELLLMTYKPMNNDWEQYIPPEVVYEIGEQISSMGVDVAVDMMTCKQCTGSKAFVTIAPNGDVYPCSFVRKKMGNTFNNDFKQIWKQRMKPKCPFLFNGQSSDIYDL